jgi:hypothetical protein
VQAHSTVQHSTYAQQQSKHSTSQGDQIWFNTNIHTTQKEKNPEDPQHSTAGRHTKKRKEERREKREKRKEKREKR